MANRDMSKPSQRNMNVVRDREPEVNFSTSAETSFVSQELMLKFSFHRLRACLPCDPSCMRVAQLLNNRPVYALTMRGVSERARWCVSLGRVCVFVSRGRIMAAEFTKTEEGFFSWNCANASEPIRACCYVCCESAPLCFTVGEGAHTHLRGIQSP